MRSLLLLGAFWLGAAPLIAQLRPPRVPSPPAAGDAKGRAGARGDERELTELPKFTPVPAPPLQGLAQKQFFWFTMYPDFVVQYDPDTDTVAKKVKLQHGLFWNTTLTHDRKRLLVVTGQQRVVEVVDLAAGAVTATHSFDEEGLILRLRDVRELPGGLHWLLRFDRVKKQVDRYSFEPAQWWLYDVEKKQATKKFAKLPEALERGAQLLPDGATWQGQDDEGNLLLLDGQKLTEQGRIDLRTQRYFGAGAIRLSGQDLLDRRDPGRLRMLFTSNDPVEKSRSTWGIVELDLVQKSITEVVEFGPSQNTWGLRIAPRKLVAAAMTGSFGERDQKARLLMYDLRTGQKIAESYEEFRPRRSLVAIAPDGDKFYIGVAGSDFEVFDAQCRRLKTVELEGEIAGRIYTIDG